MPDKHRNVSTNQGARPESDGTISTNAPERPRVRARSQGQTVLHSLPPLSLYVHVPWCVRKCPYCDFNSHELRGDLPEQDYLDALQADLEQALPLIWGRQVVSVFIGGGTPSLLSERAVDRMLAMFRAYLNLWPETEITMEANPGAVEASRFRSYATSGVNRVSLGIQSFNDDALQALGRIHDSKQAKTAIDIAQNVFGNINLDIMYALPGQTIEQCQLDLETALSFQTQHLSLYHLTMEPNTVFAKFPPQVPDDDTSAEMQDLITDLTAAGGWERYEVSAYARNGQRSVHNVNYWEYGDYLGIGPGAHGKLSFHDRVMRQARLRNPASWMAQAVQHDNSHIASENRVQPLEFPFEFMLNALRLKDGVPTGYFYERTGQPLLSIAPALARARARGLLENDLMRLRATPFGWRFLSDLQAEFFD